MKQRTVFIILVAVLIAPSFTWAGEKLTIKFAECFLKYDTMNGETEIILYDIRPSRRTKINEDVFVEVFDLTEFNITDLMVSESGNPPAIRVLAKAKNFMMNAPVEQLFSHLLNTKAKVALSKDAFPKMGMNVLLPMQENMYVADNNAVQLLQSEKKKQILIKFDISSDPLEVVIGWMKEEPPISKMEREFQHDADIFRLRHLRYYGELIAEFYEKTGRYPLQGKSPHPHYVHIAAPHQEQYAQGGPPYEHKRTGVEEFRNELEAGLGRKVDFKFDPQKVPVAAPCFYIYMIEGDECFFAVHLFNERSFANPVASHYNKVEFTNVAPSRKGLWRSSGLLENHDFITALNETPTRNGWFLHLEETYK